MLGGENESLALLFLGANCEICTSSLICVITEFVSACLLLNRTITTSSVVNFDSKNIDEVFADDRRDDVMEKNNFDNENYIEMSVHYALTSKDETK